MTDTADIVPSNAEPDITPVLGALSHQPGSVADALDVHLRLTVLSAWVNERKSTVADWLKAKGEARLAEDGAAPTWRLTDGQVILTDPKPKPAIEDRDAFAAWYEDASGELLIRRRTATVDPPDALLSLVDAVNHPDAKSQDYTASERYVCDVLAPAAEELAKAITVTEDVLLPEDVLDGLLSGDDLPDPDLGARVVIHYPVNPVEEGQRDPYLVDTTTGERVPGTTVRPAGPRTVQVRPDTKAKTRVRAELDRLLGPPQIGG